MTPDQALAALAAESQARGDYVGERLSRQEINRIAKKYFACGGLYPSDAVEYAREIEDAILAKLATPQPAVATLIDEGTKLAPQSAEMHQIVSGALYDLMGDLTSGETRYRFSASDEASPAVEALVKFAEKRSLSLDDPAIKDWHKSLTAPSPAQPDGTEIAKEAACYRWLAVQHWVEPEATIRLSLSDTDFSNQYLEELTAAIYAVISAPGKGKS